MKSTTEFLFGGYRDLQKWQKIVLTVLRLAIGWHFLYEGIAKWMMPNWTAFEYLSASNWIFKDFFIWIARTPTLLGLTDGFIMISMVIIGLLLMLGLVERFAYLWALFILLLLWVAKPPLTGLDFASVAEGNYLIIDKNTVEFFAILALFFFPSGDRKSTRLNSSH